MSTPTTPAMIEALFTGYKSDFQNGLGMAASQYKQIAMTVTSNTRSNTFGWLGQFPHFREWIGTRVMQQMAAHGYSITNKTWEDTVAISRDDFDDDILGIYSPIFQEMGRAAGCFPDELVFQALANADKTACYDGQNFFDAEHPVYEKVDGTGKMVPTSNLFTAKVGAAGATTDYTGPGWYLMDCTRVIKPIIYQNRRNPELVMQADPKTGVTFTDNQIVFGASLRSNVGYGFWQMAQMMKAPLNSDMFWEAWQAITNRKADGGRPLGLRPSVLVVPPSLEKTATKLLERELTVDEGATTTNELKGKVSLVVAQWMPAATAATA
ncbi:TPA: Mu-like prophage major head subunit gpT family protein [Salmonella enterica subsp. enterica serovar Anatum]|nr:head protein [Salmonella enterica]EEA8585312.1 head protein [Salmonella enterica subsp. enterica]EEE1090791.1 head protein [Salmonella enterica subsp. enterica serovar Beaudesert]HDN6709433.1 Mu-like prophage major head subunit gpT family protein [Salmonella enterica subsp. enterica serovar Anatum]HEC6019607.1 Mu-like prophage major head subunit gpT family protein [Salmonella enterica subsp. enterica serovar Zanzibar]